MRKNFIAGLSEILSTGLISGNLDLKDSLEQVVIALRNVAGIEHRLHEKKIILTKSVRKMPFK
jgi:hypothetical protein